MSWASPTQKLTPLHAEIGLQRNFERLKKELVEWTEQIRGSTTPCCDGRIAATPEVVVERTGVKRGADTPVEEIDPRAGDGTDVVDIEIEARKVHDLPAGTN